MNRLTMMPLWVCLSAQAEFKFVVAGYKKTEPPTVGVSLQIVMKMSGYDMGPPQIAENDIVVIVSDGHPWGIRSGDAGIVLRCIDDGRTFEVEFIGVDSSAIAILTLHISEFRLAGVDEFPALRAYNRAKHLSAGFRVRYSLWLGLAVLCGAFSAKVLEPIAKIPVWQLYAGIISTLSFIVSIPFFIVMSQKSKLASDLLKMLILIVTIFSMIAVYISL
ncbi:MAG: DUF4926 domain-containing protein [Planctomyces sp.]|nr:DUF4926 domain-containing protein [Planctomyces sp.]